MSSSTDRARRAALLMTVRGPAPLDRTPQNREQRRMADRMLRQLQTSAQRKKGWRCTNAFR